MEEKRHGGAGRVIVVILILAVLLAAGAFFLFGGRVRVETPSFSTGYRYDRAKDYATLDTFPVEGVTADKVALHWISGRVEIRAAERITVSEDFAGDDAQRLRWRLDGDTLIVQPCASGAQELPEKTLTVTLPQTVLLKVDTVSADCALTGVQTAQLDADSVSGALRGDAAVTEMLSVDTVSGGASLDLTAAPKKVTGSTVSGVMELVFDEAPGKVKLSSTSGSFALSWTGARSAATAMPRAIRPRKAAARRRSSSRRTPSPAASRSIRNELHSGEMPHGVFRRPPFLTES